MKTALFMSMLLMGCFLSPCQPELRSFDLSPNNPGRSVDALQMHRLQDDGWDCKRTSTHLEQYECSRCSLPGGPL